MNQPPLQHLAIFVAIAQAQSFQAVATKRAVSRSSLSHAMRQLENYLGVRLLNRTTRSVIPTDAGQTLLERLEPALREIDNALSEITHLQSEPSGRLRLNVPRSAARLLIAPILTIFNSNYPRIQVEIITDDDLIDVIGQGFDAGIRFKEQITDDMVAIPIGPPQKFIVVAAPSYIKHHGWPKTPEALKSHTCISRIFPQGHHYIWEFKGHNDIIRIKIKSPLTLDDDAVIVQSALAGIGIAYVYESLVTQALTVGTLVKILGNWSPPAQPFYLYYPSRCQLPLPLRLFIETIKNNPHMQSLTP